MESFLVSHKMCSMVDCLSCHCCITKTSQPSGLLFETICIYFAYVSGSFLGVVGCTLRLSWSALIILVGFGWLVWATFFSGL